MSDPTENIRRALQTEINSTPVDELPVEDRTWTTDQLREDFEVVGFMAPFVVVRRKSDGKRGSMEFKHSPRVYYNFMED
jgi:hypothetical protein